MSHELLLHIFQWLGGLVVALLLFAAGALAGHRFWRAEQMESASKALDLDQDVVAAYERRFEQFERELASLRQEVVELRQSYQREVRNNERKDRIIATKSGEIDLLQGAVLQLDDLKDSLTPTERRRITQYLRRLQKDRTALYRTLTEWQRAQDTFDAYASSDMFDETPGQTVGTSSPERTPR